MRKKLSKTEQAGLGKQVGLAQRNPTVLARHVKSRPPQNTFAAMITLSAIYALQSLFFGALVH